MQQTEKYRFNLMEGSDPFSAQPLNDNMEKVEGALTAHQAEVSAALSVQAAKVEAAETAADAAVAAHRTEVNTALATHRTQVNAALETVNTALSAQAADTAAQFAALPKIHFQSYTGNGSTSRTHTFPFVPKMVVFVPVFVTTASALVLMRGQTEAVQNTEYPPFANFSITWEDKSIQLKTRGDNATCYSIFNDRNYNYTLIAIG